MREGGEQAKLGNHNKGFTTMQVSNLLLIVNTHAPFIMWLAHNIGTDYIFVNLPPNSQYMRGGRFAI